MIETASQTIYTGRFSNRAENYAKFRPGYPDELFLFLEEQVKLEANASIVDIGSGTGLFAEPLLRHGYSVLGIEPNEDMRKAGEERLKQYQFFNSSSATAEQTGLDDRSVDLITVAQTFHWLDPEATRSECRRILKEDGHIVLAWNKESNRTEFEQKYSELRNRYRVEELGPTRIDPVAINTFFAPQHAEVNSFVNKQYLDFDGLKGQLLSKSYTPLPGHPLYDEMITELIHLFVTYNEHGKVKIEYETLVYWAQLG